MTDPFDILPGLLVRPWPVYAWRHSACDTHSALPGVVAHSKEAGRTTGCWESWYKPQSWESATDSPVLTECMCYQCRRRLKSGSMTRAGTESRTSTRSVGDAFFHAFPAIC
eukprot:78017-Rhodomonas_salina.2